MRTGDDGDQGAGLLSTVVGVLVFLLLLLLAVQVMVGLYTTSTVTAAAWDAARIASGSDAADRSRSRLDAERHLREVLGDFGDRVHVSWVEDTDAVVLRVRAANPTFLPGPVRRAMRLDVIDRTVRVQREGVR